MTTYNLTTWDRMMISQVIGALRGDVRMVRKAGKILDAVEMTEDEKLFANVRQEGGMLAWDNVDYEWPIEINDPDSLALLKEKLSANDWMGAQYKQVIRLCSVLGIELT